MSAPSVCLVIFVAAVVIFATLHGTSTTPPMSAEPTPGAPVNAPHAAPTSNRPDVPGD